MGRFTKRMFDQNSPEHNLDERYQIAYKRVKRIKDFYIHLLVYILVNGFIIISSLNRSSIGSEEFWKWETFSMAFFWGIGLVSHGISVFGSNLFFGKDWEEQQIKKIMNEEKKNQKWQ